MQKYVEHSILNHVYQKRDNWSHKGQYGKLLVVAGSQHRSGGAPYFAGLAAARAGCDLVYVAAPERAANAVANFSPNLITEILEGPRFMPKHVDQILDLAKEVRATAMVVGPGLWRERDTFRAITMLLQEVMIPCVVDADALRAVGQSPMLFKGNENFIYTPHANEFEALTNLEVKPDLHRRAPVVHKVMQKLSGIMLLKGHIDIIADKKRMAYNRTGDPRMTKGGCGDTLAGILGAYLARGIDSFTAAMAAAYVNGKAGEKAAQEKGEGMLPTDLIEKIPEVI